MSSLQKLKKKEEAMQCFDEAYAFQQEGEYTQAINLYKQSIEICPTAEAHTFLGWAYSFEQKYQAAIYECFKAIELDPDYGNPYNDIGSYLIRLGCEDESLSWFRKAIAAPRYEARVFPYFNMGRVYEIKFNYPKAIQCYKLALEENPGYLPAYVALVQIYSSMN